VRLRHLRIGCFGGGTGLPSLIGGLKMNPWLQVNAVVTMFDSGGSSGQLRDELGVLPPGDILKCALALARNEREARRVLLAAVEGRGLGVQRQLAPLDDGTVAATFSPRSATADAARLQRTRLADLGRRLSGVRGTVARTRRSQ
jgi:hypothetical protein